MVLAINTRFLIDQNLEGIGIYTHEISKRLVINNPDIEFHFFFDRPFHTKFLYAENVTAHILSPPARHPILWYYWFEYLVYQKLRQIGAHAFFSPDMYASLRSTVPTMLTCHDLTFVHYPLFNTWSHRLFSRIFYPKYLLHADAITCVSESTRNDLIEKFPIDESKIFVSTNACRDGFRPISPERKKQVHDELTNGLPYFLYLGSIHPRKNILRLIKSFEIFKEDDIHGFHLVLAGRMAWQTREIRNALKSSPYKNCILCLDEHRQDIYDLLGAAHALCYLSLFEGFGLPILEAMSAGVPVITSNRSSMPEVAGNSALLVNPENINEIAQAMKNLVHNTDLVKDLIQRGKMRAKHFSWDNSASIISDRLMTLMKKEA